MVNVYLRNRSVGSILSALTHALLVRSPAQNLLAKISEVFSPLDHLLRALTRSQIYDGVRIRVLPRIYESLVQGTDDDRMKGALYLLNYPAFGEQ